MNKLIKILKNWTLPVAMVTGVIIYILFHFIPFLKPIGDFYAPYNNNILPDFMFLILFVTFCKVDFKKLLPFMVVTLLKFSVDIYILFSKAYSPIVFTVAGN